MARCLLKLPFQHGLLKLLPDEEEVDGEQDIRESRAGLFGSLDGQGSDRMTVIDGRTFGTEIFVAKIAVETRERDFPGEDHRDGLRMYRFVNYRKSRAYDAWTN
jgi:hypothetical protein